MSDGSAIEWLQRPGTKPATWNPIRARDRATGKRGWFCKHVHEGCRFCYAEALNIKPGMSGGNGHAYAAQNLANVEVYLDEKTLLQPLHWREPRTIFVCSMSDLFGEWVPDDFIAGVFKIAKRCPQHTFIMLTKRPARMRAVLMQRVYGLLSHDLLRDGRCILPNVWLLVSISEQKDADEFVPILLDTPAAVRGVSCEPLLGPIDLTAIEAPDKVEGERWTFSALETGDYYEQWSETMLGEPRRSGGDGPHREHRLDWGIIGGESGKNARPMHPAWARKLIADCEAAGVAKFFKQWGSWAPTLDRENADATVSDAAWVRAGKKRAGRHLDGREHNEFPKGAQ